MRNSRIALISALALSAGLLAINPIRHSVISVLRLPFKLVRHASNILISLPGYPNLNKRIEELETELVKNKLENSKLRESLRSFNNTKELLEVSNSRQWIVAEVIGKSPVPFEHTILIDKGSADGIELESVVIDKNGVVGRVNELHAKSSLVVLLTDTGSRTSALVERTREIGLLVGLGSGKCVLRYLESDSDIEKGDRIISAGLGGPIPKGLLLGSVVSVGRDDNTGEASAIVRPSARLGRLEEVLCIKGVDTSKGNLP